MVIHTFVSLLYSANSVSSADNSLFHYSEVKKYNIKPLHITLYILYIKYTLYILELFQYVFSAHKKGWVVSCIISVITKNSHLLCFSIKVMVAFFQFPVFRRTVSQ